MNETVAELRSEFDIDDPDVVSAIDDLPLWSAPFGLKLLDVVELGKGLRVLDVGSGLGFPAVELSQRLGATCAVYGIDPWPAAVARARAKVRTWGIENLEIVEGVAEALPFEDGYFDLVVSNNGTNNVDDEERVFGEIARVARPGAQVAFTANLPGTMEEFYSVFRAVLHGRGLHEAVDRVDEHIAHKRKPLAHIRDVVARAGLQVRSVHEDSFDLRYSDGSAMLDNFVVKLAFLGSWKDTLAPGDVEPVFAEVESELNRVAAEVGELRLTVPWVCVDCRKP